MLDRFTAKRFLKSFEGLHYGRFDLTMPDGIHRSYVGPQPGPHGTIIIHDPRLPLQLAQKGEIAFGESYMLGRWETPDLPALLTVLLLNHLAISRYFFGSQLGKWLAAACYRLQRNTLAGSRRNIEAHYDLGNAFYRLWLDQTLTYSSALFNPGNAADDDLADAQHRKNQRLLAHLHPTGSLLEIGCGWGGFLEQAIEWGDYAARGITLSREQQKYAHDRTHGRATIALEDYRQQHGRYDNLVSVEMIENVGEAYWPAYFGQISTLLKPGGRAMLQSITIDDAVFPAYRQRGDFIRSHIFPGGLLPAMGLLDAAARHAGLAVTDCFAFGQDYARTMRHWLANVDANAPAIRALGFDDTFIRKWRYYLAYCIAGFTTGRIDVRQVALRHAA